MSLDYRSAVKIALETPETMTTLLYVILRNEYGDEAFDWDPVTLYLDMRERFQAEPVTEVMDRIAAVQVLVTSDAFFKRTDAFINICNTITDGQPSFSVFDTATTEECAWALVETALIRDMLPFSGAVSRYMRFTLKSDGYDESNYPGIFVEAFDRVPNSSDLVDHAQETLRGANNDVLDEFVQEQMNALVYQFNKIPGLSDDLMRLLDEKDEEER